MHAFLIIGNSDLLQEEIQKKAEDLKAQIIEFPITKIVDVRDLSNFTRLKLPQKTVILIKNINKSSEEAQNALLKSLEEPQENLFYILTAVNNNGIAPTITSRCEVIEIRNSKQNIQDKFKTEAIKFIDSKVGEKLKKISTITKKEDAIEFADNLILVGHEIMINKPEFASFLEETLKLKNSLESNGNVQLQLTNFIVNTNDPFPSLELKLCIM